MERTYIQGATVKGQRQQGLEIRRHSSRSALRFVPGGGLGLGVSTWGRLPLGCVKNVVRKIAVKPMMVVPNRRTVRYVEIQNR
jgi:hypothetical protein